MSKPNRKATIVGCVTMLAETFNRTTSAGLFKAYEIGLHDLSEDQITQAASKAVASCRFMPPPAELREMVFIKTEDRAVKAWMAFENAVRTCGYTKSVCFDDPVIHAVTRALGGWEACCEMPAKEFDTFLQKRFQDTYCALSRGGISAEQAAPLVGWFDRQNAIAGYDADRLVRIETGLPSISVVRVGQSAAAHQRPCDMPRLELKHA